MTEEIICASCGPVRPCSHEREHNGTQPSRGPVTTYVAWNRHGPWAVADTEQGAWNAVAERIAEYATGWPQSPNSPEWWQRRASEGILVDPIRA